MQIPVLSFAIAVPVVLVGVFFVPSLVIALRYSDSEYANVGLNRQTWLRAIVVPPVLGVAFGLGRLFVDSMGFVVVALLLAGVTIAVCSFWLVGPGWLLRQRSRGELGPGVN